MGHMGPHLELWDPTSSQPSRAPGGFGAAGVSEAGEGQRWGWWEGVCVDMCSLPFQLPRPTAAPTLASGGPAQWAWCAVVCGSGGGLLCCVMAFLFLPRGADHHTQGLAFRFFLGFASSLSWC